MTDTTPAWRTVGAGAALDAAPVELVLLVVVAAVIARAVDVLGG
ncbi:MULTISPECIES: hypothetical protein [unclassified Pseudonocardia]|nr:MULTISPECIES: hypothetical protein [unclassified Pseudonocardia]